jgi:hypothetical protein
MARFKPQSEIAESASTIQINQQVEMKNYPFKNLYGCVEADMVYVNMESIEGLVKGMVSLRDLGLLIDLSGSMQPYIKNGSVERMILQIVDQLASFDDDGIDLMFFANGLVYRQSVRNASEVRQALAQALQTEGAYGTTMPTQAFKSFCEQLKQKRRAGTVLFLTDGAMDDGGRELKSYYMNELHTQFKTRDNFYCYCIEFGRMAFGALNVLDGLFAPEQGPEDLFDLDSAENLDKISEVLAQVGGMSAVGSDVVISASVDNGKIDMVNADLIEGGMTSIQGAINKVMSFRVRSTSPFILSLEIGGYSPMRVKVTPQGLDAVIEVL